MYETPEQKEPVFDAKGIETVRRDGCQAAVKVSIHNMVQLNLNSTFLAVIDFRTLN